MSKILRLAVVLVVITFVAGVALSYVHKITVEPIEYAQVKEVKAPAVAEVLGSLKPENDPVADRKKLVVGKDKRGRDIMIFAFPAKKNGQTVAVAVETFGTGYHEGLGVMTAIGTEGEEKDKILQIAITSNSETPGKGTKAFQPAYLDQFKDLSAVETIGEGAVDAVSGATMSSKGIVEAVNKAIEIFKANQDKLIS